MDYIIKEERVVVEIVHWLAVGEPETVSKLGYN